ncbi:ferrous iron transport protein A [Flavobacteriales bacterium]|nr:ferrous iron transport protein A [Flavobacteriales bacterium]
MQNLAELLIGEKGEMIQISDNSLEQKLLEMGCTPGEKFEVVRKAPFGGPIAILISSYVLSIRKEDARSIVVRTLLSE